MLALVPPSTLPPRAAWMRPECPCASTRRLDSPAISLWSAWSCANRRPECLAVARLSLVAPPEDNARDAAWQLEHEAMLAPTATGSSTALGASLKPALAQLASSGDQTPNLAAIGKALGLGSNASPTSAAAVTETDYEAQNAQTRKDAFLKAAQNKGAAEDYLRYTRDAPLSRYEIKAGWEIPAVLEQSLNSDLPGELKALVTSNVYDTATGQYLLIPQGSRLVGKYDSRVSYGQDGVQVVWSRIIFPDASSIDLDGMMGLDSHGNAGLRDKVDRHYKRLIGMEVLTLYVHGRFRHLAKPQPDHPCLPHSQSGRRNGGRAGADYEWRSNGPPQHERAADHQGARGLPLQRARQPRHPV